MTIRIIRNDITKLDVEAIVCPSNPNLLEGSGTSYRIYKVAGEFQLNNACAKIGSCKLTHAVITSGFNLSKYIIHVVGPVYDIGDEKEEKLLYKTYENALSLAKKNNIRSIAFPLLSSGNYGFPKEISINIAIQAISSFLLKNEMDIQLVVYDQESVDYAKKIMHVEEFIDQKYVDNTNEDFADEDFKEEFYYSRRRFPNRASNYRMDKSLLKEQSFCVEDFAFSPIGECEKQQSSFTSLSYLMEQRKETFKEMLFRLIDERNLKDSEVYKKANVTKQHFNKIKNVKDYTPKKPTILSLSIAMELSLDETIDLLAKAGQAFSDCSKTDIIVQYYIERKIYNLNEINEVLNEYHLDPLCL